MNGNEGPWLLTWNLNLRACAVEKDSASIKVQSDSEFSTQLEFVVTGRWVSQCISAEVKHDEYVKFGSFAWKCSDITISAAVWWDFRLVAMIISAVIKFNKFSRNCPKAAYRGSVNVVETTHRALPSNLFECFHNNGDDLPKSKSSSKARACLVELKRVKAIRYARFWMSSCRIQFSIWMSGIHLNFRAKIHHWQMIMQMSKLLWICAWLIAKECISFEWDDWVWQFLWTLFPSWTKTQRIE